MSEQKTANGATLARSNEGTLARWNPWPEMTDLRQRMDDLFGRAFGYTPLSNLIPTEWQAAEPDIDIHETAEQFQVLASLPGYTPNQVQIEATDNSIMIQGERPALMEKEKATTHRDNGLSGSSQFRFAYTLPTEIDPNKVKATFTNGMLSLELPKTEQARSKTVKVAIHSHR